MALILRKENEIIKTKIMHEAEAVIVENKPKKP